MSISVNPVVSVIAAANAAADLVLKPGTTVEARVVRVLDNNQVRIAVGQATLDVHSDVPLQPGQVLKLAVSQQGSQLRLAIVSQQGAASAASAEQAYAAAADSVTLAPEAALKAVLTASTVQTPKNLLTAPEAAAVAVSAQTAATRQTSLAPLFGNLDAAAALPDLPAKLQTAITQVLITRQPADAPLTGTDLKTAFQNSGLFMEAALAKGAAPAAAPDLKAALLVLRQVLSTALAGAPAPGAAATAQAAPSLVPAMPGAPSASAGPIIMTAAASPAAMAMPAAEALQNFDTLNHIIPPAATPAAAGARAAAISAALSMLQASPGQASASAMADNGVMIGLVPAMAGQRKGTQVDDDVVVRTNTPPPPIRGALPAVQPVVQATLAAHVPLDTVLHQLLADTEGAIARQTLLQVASLPDRVDAPAPRLDASPRWNFEIPFITPQGTAVAQFEISRDDAAQAEAASRVWRARFSLDVEPAGPVHAMVSLIGEKTSVRLWAERPATAARLRDGAHELGLALARAELQPGDIMIRQGAPPQTAPAAAGHFLDRAL